MSETTGEGHTTSYTYDSMHRVASMKRPTGGETTYAYDGTGSLAKETDANGHTTSYVNDLYGRTTSRTLPNKATYTYAYDALGRLEKQTGPQGLSKAYTYDVSGNLTKETDQSDRSNSYTYDKLGRLLTAKNALDLETKYAYDEAGNLAKVTRPTGATTTFDYTTLDQLKTIKTPTGREITASYDPVGQVMKRTYDSLNRLTSESDTAGQWTMYHYDHDNRLTKVTNDEGGKATMAYDGNGNLTSVFSGSERVKSYTYDLENQLLTATQGTGEKASTSTYTYDSVGNVTSVTNGNGKVTKYTYDQLSHVVKRMTSLGDVETYTYNVNNQLEKVTKADGKTISYDYNKLDQLLKVDYSEKQDGQVLYTYDPDGRRVSMSDLTGTTNYAYNDEGEMTGVRQGDGSLIQYEYDDFGNISRMTYPDGSTVSYTYDELDRLTSVTDVKGKKTTYTYNDAGDMTEVKRGDGTKSFLTYDKAHRITEIRHSDQKNKLISRYGYEYDDGNYVTKETITQDGETLVHTYTYDSLGQVETMTVSTKDGKELSRLSYTYDLAGNKLSSTETVDGKEEKTSFSYDDNNRLTTLENKEGTITYTYDKNGNRISQETKNEKLAYIYDTENRLLAVKDKKGLLMAVLYDGDDNRVFTASRKEGKNTYQLFRRKEKKKSPQTSPNGEEPSLFWYGFSQNVLQSLSSFPQTVGSIWHSIFDDVSSAYHQKVAKDQATKDGLVVNPPSLGNLPGEGDVTYASQVKDVLIPYTTREDTYEYYEERNYVNDINREHTEVLQTYDHDLKARETYSYGHGRNSYLHHQTNETYQYLTNQAGSATGLTKDGALAASSSYTLYGSTKTTTDKTGNPYAYNGEARDGTGLDYLRARYYDSVAGTFLTEDSYQGEASDPLSQNRYAYVRNNPVNYTDPSGHFWKSLKKAASAAWNGVKKAASGARSIASKAWNSFRTIAGNAGNTVKKFVGNAYNKTRSIVGPVFNKAVSYVQKGVSWVGNKIGSAYNFMRGAVTQAYQSVTNLWQWAKVSGQSTYNWGKSKTPEAGSIYRNWTKALEDTIRYVCQLAARATGGTTVHASTISFDSGQTTLAYDFKQNLIKQYGFDGETADIMWKLYQSVKTVEDKDADYIFNRIIGGVSYNDLLWSETAGQAYSKSEILQKYSITSKEYNRLYVQLKLQHGISGESSESYRKEEAVKKVIENYKSQGLSLKESEVINAINNMIGKNDFTHQSITIATHLYDKPRLADAIGKVNGKKGQDSRTFINELSGWRGDVTGQALAKPSQGIDDYQADLDAANIAWLMQQGGLNYSGASSEYYYMLNNTNVTREKLFNQSVGIDYVRKELLIAENVGSMTELRAKNPVAYDFILKLEAGN